MGEEQKPAIKAGDPNRITREYFDSLLIEMRHLDGILPSAAVTIYGRVFQTPVMMAAFSHLAAFHFHDDGMVEVAKAAARLGAVNFAGMGSEDELEDIVATGASTIKIIKPYADNTRILAKIEHAQRVGAMAVGMDIDHSFSRKGEYDNIKGDEMRPKSIEEIAQFVKAAHGLPFVVKGVLSVTDALKCRDAGVQGIVVSHHHGIMDYAVPPLMVLPKIVEALGGCMPIFVDCGVDSGYDTFKALALGATAVCVGRAVLGPLKKEGADGIVTYVQKMNDDLKGIMARTGTANLASVDRSLIWGGQ